MKIFRFRKPAPEPPTARRVQELEIITSRLIRLGFAGDYHAAFHGKGIEFSQVREYQPGDDIRTIDWNVTARTGSPHVKQFIEERDLTVLLALDCSASMRFGSLDRRKIDLASELAAVLAFSAAQNADRVGLLVFSSRMHSFIPPKRGRNHVQSLVRSAILAGKQVGGTTDLSGAVQFLQRVAVKRSVIIFISDFLDVPVQKPFSRLSQKHDVIALSVGDPREQSFPSGGLIRLRDSENGRDRLVALKNSDVARLTGNHQSRLVNEFRKSGVDWVSLSTAVPYDRTLVRFFHKRISRP